MHAFGNTAALPRQLCLPWFLGRPLYWGTCIIYTGQHNISIYARKQYFHSDTYQRPCFQSYPSIPPTAHEGGESPTPFPNLSLRVLKCPFRALSPCPIQILAGALVPYNKFKTANHPAFLLWSTFNLTRKCVCKTLCPQQHA